MDLTRYSRQVLFSPIGPTGQAKLQKSRVAIVGLGALGTALANHMVRAGIGYVRLIDRDFVEASNLQRQMLYDEADAEDHLPKATAAAQKLKAINSSVDLDPHITDLTWRNAEELLSDVDLILDGSDNFDVRYLVNDVSIKYSIPWIYGGAVSARGITFTIRPGITPCLRCLFPQAPAPGTAQTCDTAGVIGPIIQVVAAYQATEAFKLLVGDTNALETRLRHFELWANHDTALQVSGQRQADCPACQQHNYDYLDPVDKQAREVSLCGRETVQITPPEQHSIDLDQLEDRLKMVGKVARNPFMLRAEVESFRFVIFPDGRILVQGTGEIPVARTLVAKYIGL
ncbi:ThiF family adenylyltransferase [Paenactinomyces guangxiensis]|uniref:ThiF family adenylyltransferase n=1 Tax=Paenactinomyces guangxiensis TaxID=1490290 RepID=A0A7W1WTW6_9BACL|nr:ThiF family adenylyltransferase [Paenactinomyces guangxiensis]MBA4495998.1 ThiF family adenylyltransferase [Paenactinomyces guangxiensis]MBH8593126.1 ThiF family adenylyltransferase [Paenactinomyces guangxiensis]